jgi:hypothetical protein
VNSSNNSLEKTQNIQKERKKVVTTQTAGGGDSMSSWYAFCLSKKAKLNHTFNYVRPCCMEAKTPNSQNMIIRLEYLNKSAPAGTAYAL